MKQLAESLQNISLRRIMQLLTVISLLAILLVQSVYYIRFSQLTAQRTQRAYMLSVSRAEDTAG